MSKTNLEYLYDKGNSLIDSLCELNALSNCVKCMNKQSCYECNVRNVKWLLEEYKEPILDDVEKKYLSAVIKPFRSRVKYISINCFSNGENRYLVIIFRDCTRMLFPNFKANTMYKGMVPNKLYTLEELGL